MALLDFLRVCQGVIFSGLGIIPSVILKDIFSTRKFLVYNSWLVTIFLFAPALAPLFGSYVMVFTNNNWHWIFNIISALVVICGLVFLVSIPETLDPEKQQAFNTKRIIINYGVITSNPKSFLLIFINCILSVAGFSFPTLMPAIYIIDFGVSPEVFSWYPFFLCAAVIVGIQLNQFFIRKGFSPVFLWKFGVWFIMTSCILNLGVSLGWFGVELSPNSILMVIMFNVILNPFLVGNMMGLYLMDYNNMTGTASSWLTALRLLFSGVLIGYISNLPRYNGATLLLSNAFIIFLVFILSLYTINRYFKGMQARQKKA